MFRTFAGAIFLIVLFAPIVIDAQFLSPEERSRLEAEYNQLQKEIVEWQKVLDETKDSLASLMRRTDEMDRISLVALAIGSTDFSAFFLEADTILTLEARLEETIDELLTITKNQEEGYQKVLAERQSRAEAIRNALFPLRDAEGIPFGTALDHAAL